MSEQESTASEEVSSSKEWADWQKQLAMLVVILAIPLILYFFRPVLSTFVYIVIFAFILGFFVKLLNRVLSYNISVILVYMLFLVLLFVGVGWLISSLASGIVSAIETLQTAINAVMPTIVPDLSIGPFDISEILGPIIKIASIGRKISFMASSGITDVVFDMFGVFAGFLADLMLIVLILLFFLLEKPKTIAALGDHIPENSRRELAILLTNLTNLFKSYLAGSILVVLFYWAFATLQLWITGVPNAFTYGFLIGLPNFIPNVGGYFSTFLIFVITLFVGSDSITMNPLILAFLEMAFFMIASGVAYYFVDVRIYSRSVNVPIWLLLLGIIAFGAAFGFLGIIMAAAVIAMVGEVLNYLFKKVQGVDPYPGEPEPPLFYENKVIAETGKPPHIEAKTA